MRFDAVRYSSIEVQGKVKFSEKIFVASNFGAQIKTARHHSRSAATPRHKFESFAY
jgi:hypothetical protein